MKIDIKIIRESLKLVRICSYDVIKDLDDMKPNIIFE